MQTGLHPAYVQYLHQLINLLWPCIIMYHDVLDFDTLGHSLHHICVGKINEGLNH